MKIKLLVAAAATVVASSAMAQSAFEGFYGQLGVGYENNTFGSNTVNVGAKAGDPTSGTGGTISGPSSTAGGFSGTVGLGYNYAVSPQWLVGLGVDYNPLSLTSNGNAVCNGCSAQSTVKVSNRLNIFVTPGYAIDKDKLVYLKAGYSMEQVQPNLPASANTFTNNYNPTSNANGYIVGLGYKQLVDKNIYVFGEGNYMGYSKVSQSGTGNNATGTSQSIATTTTPSAYQFLVGVGYKF
ncbi:outer membrane beta-barrel protein [Polynucleobacter paneuropaeus]|nr:outer membrane beta-barrel protein [Polynucleobacter paneuropaeus]